MYQIPDTIYPIVNAEVHAADVFRVLGPFSNSEKFNMDWNCPKGSKMNLVSFTNPLAPGSGLVERTLSKVGF